MNDPMAGLGEFDRWLKLAQDTGADPVIRQALVNVHDTLYSAWKSAKQCFGDNAKPEHALEICRLMVAELARLQSVERQQQEAEHERWMAKAIKDVRELGRSQPF
jgi:hypothetical protein